MSRIVPSIATPELILVLGHKRCAAKASSSRQNAYCGAEVAVAVSPSPPTRAPDRLEVDWFRCQHSTRRNSESTKQVALAPEANLADLPTQSYGLRARANHCRAPL